MVGWPQPAAEPPSSSLITCSGGMGRELEEQKWEKLMGDDKDSLNSKENQNLIKNPQVIQRQLFTTSHRKTCCPASPTAKVTLGEMSAANFIAGHDVIRHVIALWPVQISCPCHTHSQFPAHSQPTPCGDKVRSKKDLFTFCMNNGFQWYQHSFGYNLGHSTIWAA